MTNSSFKVAGYLGFVLLAAGCASHSETMTEPQDPVAVPAAPTSPANTGTLTDPTRNSLNQTGTSEQNAGSSSTPGATGNAAGQ